MNYDDVNHTELEMLARKQGAFSAHRGLERETLIELIEGRLHPDDVPEDPVDEERNSMLHMQEKWPETYHQLKCSNEHYACWDCTAARAYACAVLGCEPVVMEKVKEGKIR